MDDGTKVAELMFKASIAVKMALLKLVIKALSSYIKHLEKMKELNIKPLWKKSINKVEIIPVRALKKTINKKYDLKIEKMEFQKKNIDKFILDKKYELENYKMEITKAQQAFELAKTQNKSLEELKKLQSAIDLAENKKSKFEYEVNKKCMEMNNKLEDTKNEIKELKKDLDICDKKLNALYSNKNIETGLDHFEYENLEEKYNSSQYIDNDNNFDIDNNDKELQSKEFTHTNKSKDRVKEMFNRDPEALKIYEELNSKNSFDLSNNNFKNISVER